MIFFLVLVFGISQIPALTNWSQLSFNYFTTDAQKSIEIVTSASADADKIKTNGKFGGQFLHEISGRINHEFSFDVRNEAFFSEKSHEQRNSFMFNEIKAKLFYQYKSTYFKLQLNNRYYEAQETNFLNLPGIEYDTQQQMVNTAIVHFKQDFGRFNLTIYNSFRDLEYKYAVPEDDDDDKSGDDDEDEWESRSASDFDLFGFGKLTFKPTENLGFFIQATHKNDLNESSELNETDLGGGLEYDDRLDFFNSISGRVSYINLNSDAIDEIFTHNIFTELRYTRRFHFPLTGFVSYKNRSIYDEAQSRLLRVSNLLRIHLKYSYLTQYIQDSFVLTGIKYNPENKGNLVFGEFNQILIGELYLSGGAKLAPELYSQYSARIEYCFSPLKSIWLKTEYIDFETRFGQNIISLGTTLIF